MLFNLKNTFHHLTHTSKSFFCRTPHFIHSMSASYLLNEDPKPGKRTKTVCTIGYFLYNLRPKTESPENAGKLIDEGMSVARLNFSHGDHE